MLIDFRQRNILRYLPIIILSMLFLLIVYINSEMIRANTNLIPKEFLIFMNEWFVIFLLLYIFCTKKIYRLKLSKKILFGFLAWFLVGIAAENPWEDAYTFSNECNACYYYGFCDNKNVYYKNDDYFIFLSDNNRINVLKNVDDKYKFVYKDLKYLEKNETEDVKKYIYEIDKNLYFVAIVSENKIDELENLHLYDSDWEVVNSYGIITDNKVSLKN